jgi:hypothetical protein
VVFSGSTIGDNVAAVGAACLVLDDILSPRPQSFLIGRRGSSGDVEDRRDDLLPGAAVSGQ